MKLQRLHKLYALLTLLCFFNFTQAEEQLEKNNPLLVVLIMVKNEEHAMQRTLQPFIDAGIQDYVILDTGSEDRTIAVTQQLFDDNHIQHGYIVQEPFVNFAVSRNRNIEEAERLFPNAAFFIMIDAEWYMHNAQGLIDFCKTHVDNPANAYLFKLWRPGFKNYPNRLFKAHKNIRFEGPVHECINCYAYLKVPDDVFVHWDPTIQSMGKSCKRWERDLRLLLDEYDRDPESTRTAFYIAQTYACLQDHANAIIWYTKRSTMNGWDQENHMANYKLAEEYREMNNWPQALFYHLKAYSMRPSRIEPLIRMAEHYANEQNFIATFLFANQACKVELDTIKDDMLFIELSFYEIIRYQLLSFSAWYVGEYQIGLDATLKGLQYDPTSKQLLFNKKLYEQKLLNNAQSQYS